LDSESQQLGQDGIEEQTNASQSQNLASITFSVTSTNPQTAASQVAMPTALWPPSCVSRAKDATNPAVVHVTYNDCTGPFGLVHLNGSETVTFSPNTDGSLHAAMQDDGNLTLNGKPVKHSVAADIAIDGNLRHIKWQGSLTRVNDA